MNSKLRMVLGILIILTGVVFLLDVLMVIDAGAIFHDYWPLLIILFGIFSIIDGKSSTFVGVILILVGTYLELTILDLEILKNLKLSEFILPVILIALGLRVLIKPKS